MQQADDPESYFRQMKQAAQKGDAVAQAELGYAYMLGCGVKRDVVEGGVWVTKAAEGGNIEAQYTLGVYAELGIFGFRKDHARAVELYRETALQGSMKAQLRLGELYAAGEIVEKDEAEAAAWYRPAAAKGETKAVEALFELATDYMKWPMGKQDAFRAAFHRPLPGCRDKAEMVLAL